jgi:hypothetical protein
VGGANIQIVHYFDHGYLEEETATIHSFTVTFGANYLTGMVTNIPYNLIFITRFNDSLITITIISWDCRN